MTTDIDAVALERIRDLAKAVDLSIDTESKQGRSTLAETLQLHFRTIHQIATAALASAQPAQAGEYEGLAKQAEALKIMDEVGSNNPLGRDLASAIRTLTRPCT